jgi:glycosyltransferase involved in cell wall biosynthesis
MKKGQSLPAFFRQIAKDARKRQMSAMLLCTAQAGRCLWAARYLRAKPGCRMILGTARYTEWFEESSSGNRKRNGLKEAFLRRWRRQLLKRASSCFVHSEAEAREVLRIKPSQSIFWVPFMLGDPRSISHLRTKDRALHISIAGSVDERRRDYFLVLAIVERLLKSGRTEFKLHILGKPIGEYGQRVIAECERINQQYGNFVDYFQGYVPEDEYSRILSSSDLLVSPSLTSFYPEQGWTAAMVESIRFGIAPVFPRELDLIKEIKDLAFRYSDEDSLFAILASLLDSADARKELESRRIALSQAFDFDEWCERIREVFLECISGEVAV